MSRKRLDGCQLEHKIRICDHIIQKHLLTSSRTTQHYAILMPSDRSDPHVKNMIVAFNCNIKFKGLPSKHAEVAVIDKFRKKKNTPKSVDILVIKLSPSGIIGESRPCYHCICAMERADVPIRNVYYSSRTGEIVREKLCDMKYNPITRISSGMRFRYSKTGFDYNTMLERVISRRRKINH